MHPECKYCDNPMPPATIDGDVVCSRCGAEWADAKIMVEDEEIDYTYSYDIDEEPWWSDPDGDEDCNEDNYDEIDEDDYDELEAMERRSMEEW